MDSTEPMITYALNNKGLALDEVKIQSYASNTVL